MVGTRRLESRPMQIQESECYDCVLNEVVRYYRVELYAELTYQDAVVYL
jgi:hypothetical protein